MIWAMKLMKTNLLKKKKLVDEWWTLENRVISVNEKSGDLSFAGKVCIELLEYSRSHRLWLVSNHSEWEKNRKEYINLAEKAIQICLQIDDDYELIATYHRRKDAYVINERNLTAYFIPKSDIEVTRAYLEKVQRGIGYTKAASGYMFRRVK